MHVNDLRRSFGEVWEVMQKTFFDPKNPGKNTGPLTDLTGN